MNTQKVTMKKVKDCKNSVKYSNWGSSNNGETAGTVYLSHADYAAMGSPKEITVEVAAA